MDGCLILWQHWWRNYLTACWLESVNKKMVHGAKSGEYGGGSILPHYWLVTCQTQTLDEFTNFSRNVDRNSQGPECLKIFAFGIVCRAMWFILKFSILIVRFYSIRNVEELCYPRSMMIFNHNFVYCGNVYFGGRGRYDTISRQKKNKKSFLF